MNNEHCYICGKYGTEIHHIIKKSQNKQLQHCKLNLIPLCPFHHRDHKNGVHHNKELNHQIKLLFQNRLELLFNKDYLTREDIKEVLKIKDKPLYNLLKVLRQYPEGYKREDVIRACMGGRMITDDK